MKLLLDTHILLWASGPVDKLSQSARILLNDPQHDLVFSVASIWEVTIKIGLARDDFRVDPHVLRRGLLDNGYSELAITAAHALAIQSLPAIHRDPFDRMLVAQALSEGITLLTSDLRVAQYPAPVRLV